MDGYDDLSIYSSISVISSAKADDVIEAFKELGFDSTIERDSEGRIMNAVVFDPNQVKSATENNGDFSRENPDIRFSVSLGAPYQGSKNKIAKDIVVVMSLDLTKILGFLLWQRPTFSNFAV